MADASPLASRPPEDPTGDVAWRRELQWVYAVGDVHGEYALMLQMEELRGTGSGSAAQVPLYVGDVLTGAASLHIFWIT